MPADGANDDLVALGGDRDRRGGEIFLFLFLRGRLDFAVRVDDHLVALARRDRNGTEVDVDQQLAAWFGPRGFVNVFFSCARSGESSEGEKCGVVSRYFMVMVGFS